MALAVRNEGAKVNSDINVTPMVDVMLVLLIVFMVITPMLQNKVNVELAKVTDPTSMPDADKEDSDRCGHHSGQQGITWGKTRYRWPISVPKSVILLQNKTEKQIFMRADARAQYGTVMDAIDDVRTAGVDQVGLLTDRRNDQTDRGAC